MVVPFLEVASRIEALGGTAAAPVGGTSIDSDLAKKLRENRKNIKVNVIVELGKSLAAGGGGAAAGMAAAAGIYTTVATFATASTGTAIASLSGAAAGSATLAWLGGGSLTAGGLGMAGGAAVLTGIAMIPSMIAFGAVAAWRGKQLRKEAAEEGQRLSEALDTLLKSEEEFGVARGWGYRAAAVLRAALKGCDPKIVKLQELFPEGSNRHYDELPSDERELLDEVFEKVSHILTVEALPIWAIAASDKKLDTQQIEDLTYWNEAALEDAERVFGVEDIGPMRNY